MKKVIIKDSNKEKIEAILEKVQCRAKVRKIGYEDLVNAIKEIESKLNISSKSMMDCIADIDICAQDFPSAYSGIPESTQVLIKRCTTGWGLFHADRCRTRRESKKYIITLTDKAKDEIIKKYTIFK